ncbi:hypothetical protein Tco_0279191, partial [Tanacetum coccineum]
VRPQMRLNPEDGNKIELIRSSRPQPTVATPTEVQPTGSIISITQPKSPPMAPIADREKAIVTDDTKEPARKLVPVSRKVCQDTDALILIPYEINGRMYQLTEEQILAYLNKEEKIKKAVKEAKLLEMTKSELIKVVHEEASNVGIDPKVLKRERGGQEFKKIQDAKPEPITNVRFT